MVKKNWLVVKSHELNSWLLSPQSLKEAFTLTELKMLAIAISMIRKEDSEYKNPYGIAYSEFAELTGSSHKDIQEQMHIAGERLMRKIVRIKKGKRLASVGIVAKVITSDDKTEAEVYLHDEIQDELIGLQKNFVQYMLENVLEMKSTHSFRLYEIFAQWVVPGECYFSIEEIRSHLGISEAYKRTTDLRKYVIEQGLEEINSITDLTVKIESPKRKGRSIVGWKFSIKKKEKKEILTGSQKIKLKTAELEALKMLAETVCSVTGCDPEKYLDEKLSQAQDNPKPISSPAAWIKTVMQADLKKAMKPARPHGVKKAKKTDFHLDESRGKDYTNAELEKILLGRKKAKKEAEKDG